MLRLVSKRRLNPYGAGGDEIYTFFRQAANWAKLIAPGQTFSIKARATSCSDIPSSHLVQIRGRDAICDSIRDVRLDGSYHSCFNLLVHKQRNPFLATSPGYVHCQPCYNLSQREEISGTDETISVGLLYRNRNL